MDRCNEEDLYYACIRYCESFFHLMTVKEKMNTRIMLGMEDMREYEWRMNFEKRRYRDRFNKLKEMIGKMDYYEEQV